MMIVPLKVHLRCILVAMTKYLQKNNLLSRALVEENQTWCI